MAGTDALTGEAHNSHVMHMAYMFAHVSYFAYMCVCGTQAAQYITHQDVQHANRCGPRVEGHAERARRTARELQPRRCECHEPGVVTTERKRAEGLVWVCVCDLLVRDGTRGKLDLKGPVTHTHPYTHTHAHT